MTSEPQPNPTGGLAPDPARAFAPDLAGELERESEAAAGGIVARAVVLDVDVSDDDLDPSDEAGDAGEDDEAIDDIDAEPVDPSL